MEIWRRFSLRSPDVFTVRGPPFLPLVEKELRVGKDLQYVRVNGTLVGFLIGGLVYLILRATFGYSL